MDPKFLPIIDAAKKAGVYIKTHKPSGIENKEGRGNYVTQADLESEKIILSAISKHFPDHAVLSEESHSSIDNPLEIPHLWIVDPIDGTINYKYQRNASCIAIAYAEQGVVKASIVYNPYADELFTASLDKGAYMNEKPIRVGSAETLNDALLCTDNSHDAEKTAENFRTIASLDPTPFTLITGSMVIGLCEVAMGRFDLYYHTSFKEWDLAPGLLMVREAGGVVKTPDGKDANLTSTQIAAGNKMVVSEFLKQLRS